MYKSFLFLSVIILFSFENLYSETLIINIESKYQAAPMVAGASRTGVGGKPPTWFPPRRLVKHSIRKFKPSFQNTLNI